MEVFWKSIAAYNEATWIWQLCFIIAAAVLTCFLWFRPGKRIVLAVKALMVAESLWIAFVYYLDFCSTRDYSGVLTIFWCMVAAAWVYDMVTKFSTFEKSGKYRWWGLVMLLLPLLYPVISLLRGMTFPEMTTPMLPSGVALYMLGMLMTFNSKINFRCSPSWIYTLWANKCSTKNFCKTCCKIYYKACYKATNQTKKLYI